MFKKLEYLKTAFKALTTPADGLNCFCTFCKTVVSKTSIKQNVVAKKTFFTPRSALGRKGVESIELKVLGGQKYAMVHKGNGIIWGNPAEIRKYLLRI